MNNEEELGRLQQENASLRAELAHLRARLQGKCTCGQWLPADIAANDRYTSSRRGPGRTPRYQGSEGEQEQWPEQPDLVHVYQVENCSYCSYDLRALPAKAVERLHTLDLPPRSLLIVEHVIEQKQCPHCLRLTRARLPGSLRTPF